MRPRPLLTAEQYLPISGAQAVIRSARAGAPGAASAAARASTGSRAFVRGDIGGPPAGRRPAYRSARAGFKRVAGRAWAAAWNA